MKFRPTRRACRKAGALGLCLALLTAAAPPALAHIPHPEEELLFDGAEGPYVLRIVAVPYVDYLHVTVMFEPGSTDPLAYEPAVEVSAAPEGGRGHAVGPQTALPEAFTATHDYSTTLDAGEEGPWTVFVDVTSSVGQVSLASRVTLRHAGGIPWTAILTGLGLLAPVVWLLAIGLLERRRSRRSPESRAR